MPNELLDNFKELLNKFGETPKSNIPPPTFMEIAEIQDRENVCSNILSFYFKSDGVHNLGDLCVRSLLDCCIDKNYLDKDYSEREITTREVSREVTTDKGKRIDLVIECEDLVIIIENKIWAPLNNDLKDYSNYADQEYSKKSIVKIVLSMTEIDGELEAGFINITYTEFLKKIKKNIASKLTEANTKYLMYLTDYIETMQNHIKPNEVNEEMLKFFIKEHEQIDELNKEQKKIEDYVLRKLNEIKQLTRCKGWIHAKCYLVHDIEVTGVILRLIVTFFGGNRRVELGYG